MAPAGYLLSLELPDDLICECCREFAVSLPRGIERFLYGVCDFAFFKIDGAPVSLVYL